MKFTSFAITLSLAVTLAGCGDTKNAVPSAPLVSDTNVHKITPWVTKADGTQLLQRQSSVPFSSSVANDTQIIVDTTQKFQAIDGFGYTLTGGSAYVINRLPAESKSRLLQELFGEQENSIHISFLRISIGASDLNASVFTYDDMPAGQTDTSLQHFTLAPDADVISLLKEIIAIDPQIKILATPWTAPLWMKDNENSVGGSLKTNYYGVYANYFVKYVQAMKAEGITIYAITPQNEPLHPGNNPSLLMLAADQAKFIKNSLGPAFQQAGIDTKIIVYDHNCDRPDYPIDILRDAEARKYVDGSAFHMYAGDISALTQVHDAYPDKNVYFTEQYTAIESAFAGDLQWHIKNLIIGAPRNWSRTVLEWNLANDASFGPHTPGGCTTCKGALTIDGSNIKRNVAYYIIGHASQFVPRGSRRVESNIPGNLANVAFVTPEGKVVVIVLNEESKTITFDMKIGNAVGAVSLPPSSVGTFIL